MKKIIFLLLLATSLLAQSYIINPAKWHSQLSADATSTTFTLSSIDATALNNLRLAYGGSVRVLIYTPSTLTSTTPYFETILVDTAPSSNVFTVSAMTNYTHYTTALGASISTNLVADGECEWYSTGVWSGGSYNNMYKVINSFIGVQAFECYSHTTGSSTLAYIPIELASDENYKLSFVSKLLTGSGYAHYLRDSGGSLVLSYASETNTDWYIFTGVCKASVSGVFRFEVYNWGTGVTSTVDDISFIQNLVDNGGMESTTSWTGTNATLISNTTAVRAGTNGLQITATADSGNTYQEVPVVSTDYYTWSGWGKSSAAGHRFKFSIEGQDTGTLYYDSGWIDNTSWTERGVTFKDVTDDTVIVKAKVETNGEVAYFDDFSMVPLLKIDASTVTPAAIVWPVSLPIIER